jgi:hypothetical protein
VIESGHSIFEVMPAVVGPPKLVREKFLCVFFGILEVPKGSNKLNSVKER